MANKPRKGNEMIKLGLIALSATLAFAPVTPPLIVNRGIVIHSETGEGKLISSSGAEIAEEISNGNTSYNYSYFDGVKDGDMIISFCTFNSDGSYKYTFDYDCGYNGEDLEEI